MKPRTTLIVVAIFGLFLAYIKFFEVDKTPAQLSAQLGTPTARPAMYAVQLNADDVKSLQVSDLRAPRQVVVTRAADGWQVNQPADKIAEPFQVESAVGGLASLQTTRVLTNVTDLAPFGLVTPTLEVRFVMSDTKQYAFIVGNKAPTGSNYYIAYTGDKTQVFMVDMNSIDTVRSWLDTPPYQPTPTPTFTPTPTPSVTDTPVVTATPAVTATVTK